MVSAERTSPCQPRCGEARLPLFGIVASVLVLAVHMLCCFRVSAERSSVTQCDRARIACDDHVSQPVRSVVLDDEFAPVAGRVGSSFTYAPSLARVVW